MEYAFEVALCSHLESVTDWVLARQLGAGVAVPGTRVVDVVGVEPGPGFDDRAAVSAASLPPAAIEATVGAGEARFWKDAFPDASDGAARRAIDRAVDAGFFEVERRGGREFVRQTARYPDDWFARLVGVENKPDLGSPGGLERQLRTDVSLGVFDAVVLATESYVTRAHLNRIPDEVGVWRFDPEAGEREVVHDPTPLPTDDWGVEPGERRPLRWDVRVVSPEAKARARRRVAERAYGKGWRPTELPPCARAATTPDGRPRCSEFDRVVDPGSECGPDCPAFEAADPPETDPAALRDARTPWVADPEGVRRRQAGLDRFL